VDTDLEVVSQDHGARINEKFQRYGNKFGSEPRIPNGRRERLNRARVFLLNLIDLGYAPLIVDSWFDDLLNDQIDDGMPMDLVDAGIETPVWLLKWKNGFANMREWPRS
jgi:hypothetical protein